MITNTEKLEYEETQVENEKLKQNPTDCVVKKTFNHTWSLWYLECNRNRSWEENLSEITNFNTLKEFWSLNNLIKLPSEISPGSDYSFFKDGISPMWEDEANKIGGRWAITLTKEQGKSDLDRLWIKVILGLMDEAFDNSEQICGAVVAVRFDVDKILVWTADYTNETAILEIGHKLKEILNLGPTVKIRYRIHDDKKKKNIYKI